MSLDPRRASRIPSAGASTPPVTLVQTTPPFTDPGGRPPADGSPVPGYEITGEIARGGMGAVYAARDLTLDREVAVKTLLPGADPARFVTEAKITARLPHPGIPPVHALGTLPDGGHFLAMKLIRGRTLAKLLKERPSPDADLSRFVQVFEQIAQAVGFAHSRGILHRDLKPANVMVGEFGEVQVVDWGLAKEAQAVDPDVPSAAPAPASPEHTQAGQIMGTPAYMAPEQARGEPVDARADVFALGGILAVILTDNPPFVGNTVMDTVLKAAQGELGECFEELDDCAADGELVEIAKRALAPHPADRYSSGQELAAAVAAYRAGVEERLRDAETERAKARVREAEQRKRRRAIQIAGGITLGVLLLGVIGTSVGMVRANAAADKERIANTTAQTAKTNAEQARDAEKVAKVKAVDAAAKEKVAKEKAEKRLVQIEKGVLQITGLMKGINPRDEKVGGPTVYQQLRERAEKAADEIDAEAVGDPVALAVMQNIFAETLLGLGSIKKAEELLEKARTTLERELGADHPDTLLVLGNLAHAYGLAGKFRESIDLHIRVRDAHTKKSGPDHPDTLAALHNLAAAYFAAGKVREATALWERVSTAKGADRAGTLTNLANIAAGYLNEGKVSEATTLLEQVCDAQTQSLGPDHLDTLTTHNNLASAYMTAGKVPEAIRHFEAVRDAFVRNLGADHPHALSVTSNLAIAYEAAGRSQEAIALLRQVCDAQTKKLGDDHPTVLTMRNNLAGALFQAGKKAEAIELWEAVHAAQVKKQGADHPDTIAVLGNLAVAYRDSGKVAEAIPMLEKVRDAQVKKLGADHPDTLLTLNNLARAYRVAGKLDQALPLYEQSAVGVERRRFEHYEAASIIGRTMAAYEAAGQPDKADDWEQKWLAHLGAKTAANDVEYAGRLAVLGLRFLERKRWTNAEAVLRECVTIRDKAAPDEWTTFNARSMLGEALAGQKKYAEAEPLLLKGYEGLKAREAKIPPDAPPRVAEALDRLVEFYTTTGKPDEVAKWGAERAKYPFVAPLPHEAKRP